MDTLHLVCILFPLYTLIIVAIIRLFIVLPSFNASKLQNNYKEPLRLSNYRHGSNIMILLGSGGHTGEMIRMLAKVDLKFLNRIWVSSSYDSTSIYKMKEYKENYLHDSEFKDTHIVVSRARSVGESFILSIFSTVKSICSSIIQIYSMPQFPDILLLNGPGTSVALAYVLFIFKYCGLCKTKIIYIESLARVSRLSMSGYLLLPIADRFVVQWKQLYYKHKRSEYYGILI